MARIQCGDEARLLARRQGSIRTAPAREQILARFAPGHAKYSSRAWRVPPSARTGRAGRSCLADVGAVDGVAIGCHVFDTERDKIASPQLAVDGQVEQSQVARAALQLQLGPD